MKAFNMGKKSLLLICTVIFAGMTLLVHCHKPSRQEEKTFAISGVDFHDLGWGKNNLTLKAKNLRREPRKLIITINSSYLNGGRWTPNQNSVEFDFKPLEEKEVNRYFFIRPDHGKLEIRLHIQSQAESGIRETVLYKEHPYEFKAPNEKIHPLEYTFPEIFGLEKATYPPFKYSTTEHFIFYYLPDSEEEKSIQNILAEWERSFSELMAEYETDITEKITAFLIPDNNSSIMTLLHRGGRMISHNTIILTKGKDHDAKQNLRSFFHISPLLASRASNFWATMGGYGDEGLNNRVLRIKVVLCLYEGLNIDEMTEILELPEIQIREIIDLLEGLTIVKREGEKYKPNLMILTQDEIRQILTNVNASSLAVAGLIEDNWREIKRTYNQLSFADVFPIERTGFHFVGSLLLESGMLDIFFKDRTVLSPYPSRPRKNDPEAKKLRFYCILMEGREFHKRLYGLSSRGYVDNPKVISYGRYADNHPRKLFDRNLKLLVEQSGGRDRFISDFLPEYRNRMNDPGYISPSSSINSLLNDFPYRMPIYNETDLSKVKHLISDLGAEILGLFKRDREDLELLFQSLKGSEFSHFDEFFYFYYHFVFAQVTNHLAERGLFRMPEYLFDYWMQEGPIFNLE